MCLFATPIRRGDLMEIASLFFGFSDEFKMMQMLKTNLFYTWFIETFFLSSSIPSKATECEFILSTTKVEITLIGFVFIQSSNFILHFTLNCNSLHMLTIAMISLLRSNFNSLPMVTYSYPTVSQCSLIRHFIDLLFCNIGFL